MSNPNKQRGTSWETVVVNFLNECGLNAKRTGSAAADMGDIHAGEWTVEAKAEKTIDLPGYLRQLADAVERRQAWEDAYAFKSAVVVKNRRHSVKDGYAVMALENFRALMVYVNALEGTLGEITTQLLKTEDALTDAENAVERLTP